MCLSSRSRTNFYPRPPRGGRLRDAVLLFFVIEISIHALREEGDPDGAYTRGNDAHISIHALREEGDFQQAAVYSYHQIFLSTPSARRATLCAAVLYVFIIFLSTPSARRATLLAESAFLLRTISIHALREEGDEARIKQFLGECIFLSTPSARRATRAANSFAQAEIFLSTPSARRATLVLYFFFRHFRHFYPRPPRGGRPACEIVMEFVY